MELGKYRKGLVALATAVVEVAAVWADAPPWFLIAAAVAGVVLVYATPNKQDRPVVDPAAVVEVVQGLRVGSLTAEQAAGELSRVIQPRHRAAR